jgi:hypothetical protein
MTLPRANSNRRLHAGHSMGSGAAKLGGCPAALRLVPSYGHTTKFTYCRIRCITIMRSLPGRPLRADSGRCGRSGSGQSAARMNDDAQPIRGFGYWIYDCVGTGPVVRAALELATVAALWAPCRARRRSVDFRRRTFISLISRCIASMQRSCSGLLSQGYSNTVAHSSRQKRAARDSNSRVTGQVYFGLDVAEQV